MAMTTLIWHALVAGSWKISLVGIGAAMVVNGAYYAAYLAMDRLLLASSVTHEMVPPSFLHLIVIGMVVIGFLGVFALQTAASSLARSPVIRALYVHAANGFYCDIPARQITARIWGLTTPVP
jgi:hypothetical protein